MGGADSLPVGETPATIALDSTSADRPEDVDRKAYGENGRNRTWRSLRFAFAAGAVHAHVAQHCLGSASGGAHVCGGRWDIPLTYSSATTIEDVFTGNADFTSQFWRT